MSDVHTREAHWQKAWAEAKVFEANPDGRKKFFCTFPYPYVNGLPHIGHLFTMMRVEAFARYKRMQGYNVLFPQAWHATGVPITAAARRVAEGDPKQIQILQDNGVPKDELELFKQPEHWIKYFAPRYKQDVARVGLSIDWRREFITTSLNPHYDKFIRWQFLTLHDKGLVQQGSHPVVWCPKDQAPVGDHDRSVGEGETPQEFTILKFRMRDGSFLVAATLRPETVYGQTNLWVGKEIMYAKIKVGHETWVVSEPAVEKLVSQDRKVERIGTVSGRSLLGEFVHAPAVESEIPVLPSHFCSPDKGTGIVTSVPSDAPDDWMGLHDLQQPGVAEKEGIPHNIVTHIRPIPIIQTDIGDMAAVRMCDEMHIKSQHERQKLEEAKKIVYKKGFYEGVMLVGPYKGLPVQEAKEKMKRDLLERGKAELFYELTGRVVCRCQTPAVVKIVSDQWFMKYGDVDWKQKAHMALNNVALYPERARQQFEYVIDWLNDWACTREYGLGTRLPWDDRWLIESLSDSTIYMAYYTVAHRIKHIPAETLTREFFDYVYLGKGVAPNDEARHLREEFLYWYPVDFRNSGKDLVQNHLTFFLFNHCAIFPKELWPKGIGVNGWVTVNGQKMSKSLGNVIPVRKLVDEFGADATRMTILNGGEGLDDPNWDSDFARSISAKLSTLLRVQEVGTAVEPTPVDGWLRSTMNKILKRVTEAMELTNFRTAIQLAFFEYNQMLKWYATRARPNPQLLREALQVQLLMLAPFVPHVCEEAWRAAGHKGFISVAQWPRVDESLIDDSLERQEEMIRALTEEVQHALKTVPKPATLTFFLADDWKREAYAAFDEKVRATRNPGEILKALSATHLHKHGPELVRLVTFLIKGGRVPQEIPTAAEEREWLASAKAYFEQLTGAAVEIRAAHEDSVPKSKNGLPGKPAVHLG